MHIPPHHAFYGSCQADHHMSPLPCPQLLLLCTPTLQHLPPPNSYSHAPPTSLQHLIPPNSYSYAPPPFNICSPPTATPMPPRPSTSAPPQLLTLTPPLPLPPPPYLLMGRGHLSKVHACSRQCVQRSASSTDTSTNSRSRLLPRHVAKGSDNIMLNLWQPGSVRLPAEGELLNDMPGVDELQQGQGGLGELSQVSLHLHMCLACRHILLTKHNDLGGRRGASQVQGSEAWGQTRGGEERGH